VGKAQFVWGMGGGGVGRKKEKRIPERQPVRRKEGGVRGNSKNCTTANRAKIKTQFEYNLLTREKGVRAGSGDQEESMMTITGATQGSS